MKISELVTPVAKASLLAAVLATSVALVPTTASAGGFQIPEVGTRRTGMAAVVGRPDDGSAVFHNPAGITLLDGIHVYAHAGGAFIKTEFNIRPWDLQDDGTYGSDEFLGTTAGPDGYYSTVKPSRAYGVIPMLVVSAQVTRKLYAAVSAYVGNATGAKFPESANTQYHLIDGYVIAPQANLTMAYKVSDALALGASFGVLNLQVKGKRYFYPKVALVPGQPPIDLRSLGLGDHPLFKLEGTAWAPAWNAGLLATPAPGLSFGFSVTGKVETQYKGTLALESSEDPNNSMYGTQTTTQYLPLTFAGGVNYDVTPHLELGIETRFWYYKPYKEQVTKVKGLILPNLELRTQKNFRNSQQVSGGLRIHDLKPLPGLELMLGAHYDRTPAPAETLTLDQPSFSHPGLHSGVRYQRGPHRLSVTYTRYWYDVPTVEDSQTFPPLNFKGNGVSNIVSLSYEGAFGAGPLVGK